jgi:hypothetical protein
MDILDNYSTMYYACNGRERSKIMKKSSWKFLSLAILTAALSGACMEPFSPVEDPVEYDAQGRRLVKIKVDPEGASRAVNLAVAQTYINFYEVVFEGPGNAKEYYSAVARKGAGNRLSVRVPVGTYTGYLNAGYVDPDDNKAVLLAQADTGPHDAVSGSWIFNLEELKLQVNHDPANPAALGSPKTSAFGDPIYVTFDTSPATILATSTGIPYYAPAVNTSVTVKVKVTTGVENVVDYNEHSVEVIPLIRTSDYPPAVVLPIAILATGTETPTLTPTAFGTDQDGTFEFKFTTLADGDMEKGVLNIGFDVSVATKAIDRNTGPAAVRWHIRNGLTVNRYDYVKDNNTNIGAGLVFAFKGAVPEAQDTWEISVSPGEATAGF